MTTSLWVLMSKVYYVVFRVLVMLGKTQQFIIYLFLMLLVYLFFLEGSLSFVFFLSSVLPPKTSSSEN